MSFNLQIISPEKTLFDESIEMVIIPGTEGDIGVLSNHMPLITSLRLGNIYIYKDKKVIKKFLVNGGILEVIENRCTSDALNPVDFWLSQRWIQFIDVACYKNFIFPLNHTAAGKKET